MDVVLNDGQPALIARLAQALKDLLGTVGVGLQPLADLCLVGIELARSRHLQTRSIAGLGQPLGDGLGIELQGTGELPFPFPVGANGIAVHDRVVYVGVTEQGHIVGIPIEADGSAGEPFVPKSALFPRYGESLMGARSGAAVPSDA